MGLIMDIQIGIQPNCSEVALIIYPDKLSKTQYNFFGKFCAQKDLHLQLTQKENLVYENESKSELIDLKEALVELAEWEHIKFEEGKQFDLIRDESYYDMKAEGKI